MSVCSVLFMSRVTFPIQASYLLVDSVSWYLNSNFDTLTESQRKDLNQEIHRLSSWTHAQFTERYDIIKEEEDAWNVLKMMKFS